MAKIPFQGRQVEATLVATIQDEEHWNEYQLVDGSVIRLKVVAHEIYRVHDQYLPDGNPVYAVKSSNIMNVRSPEDLRRKKE